MTKDQKPESADPSSNTPETEDSGQTWPQVCRRKHNKDLIRRMRNGEALWSFDSSASWFPERRKIPKDPEALERLYGPDFDKSLIKDEPKRPSERKDDNGSTENVIALFPQNSGRAS